SRNFSLALPTDVQPVCQYKNLNKLRRIMGRLSRSTESANVFLSLSTCEFVRNSLKPLRAFCSRVSQSPTLHQETPTLSDFDCRFFAEEAGSTVKSLSESGRREEII